MGNNFTCSSCDHPCHALPEGHRGMKYCHYILSYYSDKVPYEEVEVYNEKIPITDATSISSSTSTHTVYEKVRRTGYKVTYKTKLTPRWVNTYDSRGGYYVQDESQIREETPYEYYEDVPVTRHGRSSPGTFRLERRERKVTKYKWVGMRTRNCKCETCTCAKCMVYSLAKCAYEHLPMNLSSLNLLRMSCFYKKEEVSNEQKLLTSFKFEN
jgi:hypothetical protein